MPSSFRFRLSASIALLALTAPVAADPAKPRYGSFGVDLTAQKKGVKPGDDFWTFANGAWADRTPIAADRTSLTGFTTLADQAELDVRAILDQAAADPGAQGSTSQQLGDFYASFMDEAGIEAKGIEPLKPYLAQIDAVKDRADLQRLFASVGYAGPVGMAPLPDFADPTRYAVIAGQGDLGMGTRDYYLLTGAKYDGYRAAYRAYATKLFDMAGIPDAAARIDRVVALETEMAKVEWSPEQSRDLKAIYKPMDAAGRHALAPDFDWEMMLKTAGLGGVEPVIMSQSTALTALGKLFAATPVDTWKDWLTFRFISDNATYLPKTFADARFDFYSKTLNDVPEQRARWKRAVALANDAMGEAIGKVYVEKHYPPESEAKMAELIVNLRAALKQRLQANNWMDAKTKAAALIKLDQFEPRIGHPAKYIDYSSLKVVRGDVLGNAQRAAQFEWNLQLSRLPHPVDRSLWQLTPQTINAYYDPLANQITFPAAILQPPFFDPNADPAVNYGAIGAVIGHEIGHGFDDQGSQFDGTGKFTNWWTPAAKTAFAKRTGALKDQYSAFEGLPGVHVNGGLTLGENIGDLGGIEMAYAAYHMYLAKHGPAKVIDGLTGDQRFFRAYAQVWQAKYRDGALRQQLLSNPHSPGYFRVNGVVRNVDAWYKSFGVKPGDKLYLPPQQRVHIW